MNERTQFSVFSNKAKPISFPLKLLWKMDINLNSGYASYVGSPLVSGKCLYFDAVSEKMLTPKELFSVQKCDGKKLWKFTFNQPKYISMPNEFCLFENSVLISDGISDLLRIEDGDLSHKFNGLGVLTGTPLIHQGVLLLSKVDGVYFIRLTDMKIINVFKVERPHTVNFYEDKVIFGSREEKPNLYCIHFSSGKLIWKHPIYETGKYRLLPATKKEREIGGKLTYGEFKSYIPIVGSGKVICSIGKYFSAFDLQTGKLLWQVENHFFRDSIYQNGKIYGFDGTKFICLKSETGDTSYEVNTGKRNASPSMPFLAGKIFFVGTELGLFAFDIKSGELVWKYDEEGGFTVQPCFIDGKLYAGKSGIPGSMYCFEGKQRG